jgi:hypothetical protein
VLGIGGKAGKSRGRKGEKVRRTRSALGIRGGDGVNIWGRRGQEGMLGSHSLLNTYQVVARFKDERVGDDSYLVWKSLKQDRSPSRQTQGNDRLLLLTN